MSLPAQFNLTGRIAVMTSGLRGIGPRIAESPGGLGAAIALVARKPVELETAMASLRAQSIEVATFAADLRRAADIAPLVAPILARFGRIDILVSKAGTAWAECPGFFRAKLAGALIDRLETRLIAETPLARLAEDADFNGAAAFLCSDASRHVIGPMLMVDGGMSAC